MPLLDDPAGVARLARAIASDLSLYNEDSLTQWAETSAIPESMEEALREAYALFDRRVTASRAHDDLFVTTVVTLFGQRLARNSNAPPPDLATAVQRVTHKGTPPAPGPPPQVPYRDAPPREMSRSFAVLPVRDVVLLPHASILLEITRVGSIAALDAAMTVEGHYVALFLQRFSDTAAPTTADLHAIGTLGRVERLLRDDTGAAFALVSGVCRVRLEEVTASTPFVVATVSKVESTGIHDDAPELVATLRQRALDALHTFPVLTQTTLARVDALTDPGALADALVPGLGLELETQLELLSTADVGTRTRRVLALLERELALREMRAMARPLVDLTRRPLR
jgi:Lon protease-like protein